MTASKYERQRERVIPPHVSLRDLRLALGLTLDQVIARWVEEFPELKPPTRGALSAIETGTRGASDLMLSALAASYGLPSGAITTTYQPRTAEAAA